MITEDQSEVVAFLASPSTHDGAVVERIDTHASIVFLAGTGALKLKRAVRYDYLDFSTVERRQAMCEAEVRINCRTAPALYRGVLPVARQSDGSLALGGSGTPVDWLVEMARFDQDGLFDRLAAWSNTVRRLLADPAIDDAERERRFVEEAMLDVQRVVGPAEAEQYGRAGRLDYSWQGLARYWRKKV